MRNGLFRPEALASQGPRLQGKVILLPGLPMLTCCVLLVIWLMAALVFLAQHDFRRQATVTGWVEPVEGVVRIPAPANGGLVTQVLVKNGDTVTQGQPLLVIEQATALPGGALAHEQLAAEFANQLMMLDQQVKQADTLWAQQQTRFIRREQAAQMTETQLNSLLTTSHQRYQLLANRFARLQPLSGQHIARSEVEMLHTQVLQAKEQWQQHQHSASLHAQARLDAVAQRQEQQVQHASKLASLAQRRSELQQQLTRLASQTQQVITASSAGTVTNLNVKAGQPLAGHTSLLNLLPGSARLQAHMLIPVRDAGFVAPGQTVQLRYDAFPYQKFGMHTARVDQVSRTALLPTDTRHLPVAVSEPVFRASVQLDEQQLSAYGQAIHLRSGMTFSASVTLSERSLLEWLLEPVLSLRGNI